MKTERILEDLWQDLRFSTRSLRRRPAFTGMVIATLAIGIAANIAIFSLVNTVLLRSLPVPEPDNLALFTDGRSVGRLLGVPSNDGLVSLYPYSLYKRLRDGIGGMKVAAQDSALVPSLLRGHVTQASAGEKSASGRCVTANFFDVLGIRAYRGRTFTAEDEAQGSNPSLVLSHGYWQRELGGDSQIVGATLNVNSSHYTVIGITPPGFTGATVGGATDFWVPMSMADTFTRAGMSISEPRYSWLHVFGRLEPGTTLSSAEANANVILAPFLADLTAALGRSMGTMRIQLLPGATGFSVMRRNFREPLLILMAGVALLQIIVSLNVSHLMLARAMSRQQEMSMRAALGATRSRVVRQLLTEGVVLAVLGAAAGLVGARWLTGTLVSIASGASGAQAVNLAVETDASVQLFALGLAVVTALLLGLVPAWHTWRTDLQQALRAMALTTTTGGSHQFVGRVLLASQVAFSLVLLVAAGLLSTSLGRLREIRLGVDQEHILIAQLNLDLAGVSEERAQFLYEELPRHVAAVPGVRAASLARPGILNGRVGATIKFPGTDLPPKNFALYLITTGYFDALGMRVLRGRGFQSSDTRDTPRVAVVNETMAANEFGGRDALGQRIRVDDSHDVEIVGVVSDARTQSIQRKTAPLFYLPAAQPHGIPARLPLESLEIRAVGDPAQITEQVRRAIAAVQSDLTLLNVRTLNEQVDRTLVRERLLALLAGAFGIGALFLVAVGLYGVISQWATQRTREIGVRLALGATPLAVQWLVLRQALLLVLIGLGFGLPASLIVAQLLKGLLFDVTPSHPLVLIGSVLLLLFVATSAAFLPARRASRLSPIIAIRCD